MGPSRIEAVGRKAAARESTCPRSPRAPRGGSTPSEALGEEKEAARDEKEEEKEEAGEEKERR